MSFTISFDASTAFRAAMEEQMARISQTIEAIEPSDADADEMRNRLETQRADLERRLGGMNANAESTPEHDKIPTPTSMVEAVDPIRHTLSDVDSTSEGISRKKEAIRKKICPELRRVAIPDSRFDYDFGSFIPDFEDSSLAVARLVALPCYKEAQFIFIMADNSLEGLRRRALHAGKLVLTTTYENRRGFFLLDPVAIPHMLWDSACMLDGLERFGRAINPAQLLRMGRDIDLVVTGAISVDAKGWVIRNGSGCFDLATAALFTLGVVKAGTMTAVVVHDCQVSDQECLYMTDQDTPCDIVITPNKVLSFDRCHEIGHGIEWDRIDDSKMEKVPLLKELRNMIAEGVVCQPRSRSSTRGKSATTERKKQLLSRSR